MSKRTLSLVVLLVLAFLVNACGMSGKPSVDEAVAHLREAQKQQTRIHAVVEVRPGVSGNESQSNSERTLIEEWVDGPHKIRMEYKEGPDFLKGTIAVANGEEAWWYDTKRNLYFTTRMADLDFGPFSPRLTQGMVGYALKGCDFKRVSKDTMAGREAFKLEAVPKEKAAESPFLNFPSRVTFWVDAKTWNVLGWEWKTSKGKSCMCARSVEYDPQFPKDIFQFHPSSGARELNVSEPVQISLEDADKRVGFHVLRPTYLPKGVKLLMVRALLEDGNRGVGVMLEYGLGGPEGFMIMETRTPKGIDGKSLLSSGAGLEKVKVHGKGAVLARGTDGYPSLQWIEDGLTIAVNGPLKKEALLKVAESME